MQTYHRSGTMVGDRLEIDQRAAEHALNNSLIGTHQLIKQQRYRHGRAYGHSGSMNTSDGLVVVLNHKLGNGKMSKDAVIEAIDQYEQEYKQCPNCKKVGKIVETLVGESSTEKRFHNLGVLLVGRKPK